ncbi:hypothetical protein [Agaribacter marinus]|uniref:Uncharacterized protein n=1 Tax=Agaribacter marinus TaxID=1431249 RepID=A0AA37SWV7_9ALTE|nr:hypothetical protein [Agaribacter marinus]GLR70139.1 hypothetical protein GCM10007852_10470 [Agaribacter marinus]
MKDVIDIHTLLSTPADMEDWHDDPDDASDALNMVLHLTYDRADDDIDSDKLNEKLAEVWEKWHTDANLTDVDADDLVDWVDHLLNN